MRNPRLREVKQFACDQIVSGRCKFTIQVSSAPKPVVFYPLNLLHSFHAVFLGEKCYLQQGSCSERIRTISLAGQGLHLSGMVHHEGLKLDTKGCKGEQPFSFLLKKQKGSSGIYQKLIMCSAPFPGAVTFHLIPNPNRCDS